MTLSYPKTLTKIDFRLERTLSFHTLNTHILIIKRDSDDDRSLAKILSRARVHIPEAKNWNLGPSITILMGFLRILNFGEKCTSNGVLQLMQMLKNVKKCILVFSGVPKSMTKIVCNFVFQISKT